MKPLTRKEKIYGIALGLGIMMDNRKDGDHKNIFNGLKMLRYLIEESDVKELSELAERGSICEEIDFSKLTNEPDPEADKIILDTMHELPKMERYACIAVGMAKVLKAGGDHLIKAHKRLLKAMVNEEDIQLCQEMMHNGLKKCGCDSCKKRLRVIERTEALNGTLDSVSMEEFENIISSLSEDDEPAAPNDNTETTTEDPWKAFGA